MSETLQILYMQTRLIRLASAEWHLSMEKVNEIFKRNQVYRYIADFWGIFHVESDHAVLEDISEYLKSKGELQWLPG